MFARAASNNKEGDGGGALGEEEETVQRAASKEDGGRDYDTLQLRQQTNKDCKKSTSSSRSNLLIDLLRDILGGNLQQLANALQRQLGAVGEDEELDEEEEEKKVDEKATEGGGKGGITRQTGEANCVRLVVHIQAEDHLHNLGDGDGHCNGPRDAHLDGFEGIVAVHRRVNCKVLQ